MVSPSCPPEGTGSGASILLDTIKGLLWEALGCLGSARNMKDTLCVQSPVPRESPPSVRLGKSSSAPSLSGPLRGGALSACRRRGAVAVCAPGPSPAAMGRQRGAGWQDRCPRVLRVRGVIPAEPTCLQGDTSGPGGPGRGAVVKHSGMFVFLQRFVIKKRQNEFLLGASLSPRWHWSRLISHWGFQQPRTWRPVAGTAPR